MDLNANRKMMTEANGTDLLKLFSGTNNVIMTLATMLAMVKLPRFLTGKTISFRSGLISFPH